MRWKHANNNKEIVELKDTVKCMAKMLIKQNDRINELVHKDESNDLCDMRNNLLIHGIIESKNENCIAVVSSFFKNIMKIDVNVQIQYAHRLGKTGNNRPMLVRLKTSGEKGKVYLHSKALKDIKNEQNKKYRIRDQLPAKHAAKDVRHRDLVWQNQQKSPLQTPTMSFIKGKSANQ